MVQWCLTWVHMVTYVLLNSIYRKGGVVRLERTQMIVFMYRRGCPILEEQVGDEVHMVGEIAIATVKWWAALAIGICVECMALHTSGW